MKKWKKNIVGDNEPICKVLAAINASDLKIAFIVNAQGTLVGSVTDGDVRRGLLKSTKLSDQVNTVMNTHPITCSPDTSAHQRNHLFSKHRVKYLPVVENGLIVDIIAFDDTQERRELQNPFLIIAGGLGTRLRPLTDKCPKPMLPVGDKPMIEHILWNAAQQGFKNFYISTFYLGEQIKAHFGNGSKFNVKICYVDEKRPLGTAGAVSLLPKNIPNLPIIVANGDVLTNLDYSKMVSFHQEKNAEATVCVREISHQIPYGVIERNDGLVTQITEKPTFFYYINTGVYVLSKSSVKKMKKNVPIDMPQHLSALMHGGDPVAAMNFQGYWLDIGSISDYEKAQRDVKDIFN